MSIHNICHVVSGLTDPGSIQVPSCYVNGGQVSFHCVRHMESSCPTQSLRAWQFLSPSSAPVSHHQGNQPFVTVHIPTVARDHGKMKPRSPDSTRSLVICTASTMKQPCLFLGRKACTALSRYHIGNRLHRCKASNHKSLPAAFASLSPQHCF